MKPPHAFARLFAATLLLAAATGISHGQIQTPPSRIDYQGQVLDSNGNPLAPTTPTNYTMQFRLWSAQTAGTLIWSEAQTVTVNKGAFSVRLGEGVAIAGENPVPSVSNASGLINAFAQRDRYLGLTVVQTGVTPAEITPRLAFLTSPFSFNSNKAFEADSITILDAGGNNRVTSVKLDQIFDMSNRASPTTWKLKEVNIPAGVSVPVGGVIMWWGSSAALPAGFELCDGGTPAAGSVLTGAKPNLTDRFVKGAASNSGNVATTNAAGGSNTTAPNTTGGTALTQTQLPPFTLPHSLAVSATNSAHQHTVIYGNGEATTLAANDEVGDRGWWAVGDRAGTEVGLGLKTAVDGAHTHALTGTITSGGGGLAHTHPIPPEDNRPAYLEMFYIIRVR